MFKNKKGDSVPVWYKGYDIKWLKYDAGEIHPDYKLVKEYEAEYGEF